MMYSISIKAPDISQPIQPLTKKFLMLDLLKYNSSNEEGWFWLEKEEAVHLILVRNKLCRVRGVTKSVRPAREDVKQQSISDLITT